MPELIDIPVGTTVKVLSGRAKGRIGTVIKETDLFVYVKVNGLTPPIVRVGKWNVQVLKTKGGKGKL